MTDVWTEAWEEAEATNPPGVDVYDTLELRHDAFVDIIEGPFAARVINGVPDDTMLTLEDESVLNGGESVKFKAIAFHSERPEFADGTTPSCKISVDNVGDELKPYLEAAVALRSDLTAIYRQFRSDDTSEPCYGPVEFTIKKVTVSSTRLEGMATLDNLSNKKFPTKLFTFEDFPGLLNA